MNPKRHTYVLLLCFHFELAWTEQSFGGGFAIPPQTAKAESMGGAAIAGVDDPSAVYVNPAALTEIDGNQIISGFTYINTISSVRNSGVTSRNLHDDDFLPNLFANYHIDNSKVSLGIGSYAPFGLAVSYKPDSFTRYAAIRTELKTIFVTPAIAWQPFSSLSIGAGLSFIHASGLLARALFFGPFGDGKLRLTDTDNAYGYHFGLLVKPTKDLRLGLTYKGRVNVGFDSADVKFTDASGAGGGTSAAKATGLHLSLPPGINFGIRWQMNPSWALEFEYNFTRWSEFEHLKASFTPSLPALGGLASIRGFFIPQNWHDTNTLRLGASYKLNQSLELRGGMALDETPIPANNLGPAIPGADYLSISGGLGYHWHRLKMDLGYMAVFYKTRRVRNNVLETGDNPAAIPFPGVPGKDKHKIFQNLVGLHFGYTF
jgi:long-chain fatty acid transport protein